LDDEEIRHGVKNINVVYPQVDKILLSGFIYEGREDKSDTVSKRDIILFMRIV
jgi:hypothetical protein